MGLASRSQARSTWLESFENHIPTKGATLARNVVLALFAAACGCYLYLFLETVQEESSALSEESVNLSEVGQILDPVVDHLLPSALCIEYLIFPTFCLLRNRTGYAQEQRFAGVCGFVALSFLDMAQYSPEIYK